MGEVSVGAAGFSGFKLLSKRPGLVLFWAFFIVAAVLVQGVLFVVLAGGALMSMAGSMDQIATDPAATAQIFSRLALPYAILLVSSLLINAVLISAVNRAVLRPEDSSAGYLRLSGDEWRQVLLMLAIGIPMMVFYVLVVVVSSVIGALASVVEPVLGAVVVVLLVIGLMSVPLVRFSLAGPQTFDTRAINIFGSWGLTKNRFWPLLGAYALSWLVVCLLILAVILVMVVVMVVLAGASFNPDMLQRLETDPGSAAAGMIGVIAIFAMFYLIVAPILGAVATAGVTAPPAQIYKQIVPSGPEAAF